MSASNTKDPLTDVAVRVGATAASKEAAIREVGQLLIATGKVGPEFIGSMLRRELTATTYLGEGIAIPHGMLEDKGLVKQDGVAVLQIPGGVEWLPGKVVRLVIGIAAASDGHIAILRRLTGMMQDDKLLEELCMTADAERIRSALTGQSNTPQEIATDLAQSITWTMDYPAGLHARPAALWAEAAKKLSIPLRIRCADRIADPRNPVSLLRLGAVAGDLLTLSAEGVGAESALQHFRDVIQSLSAEEKAAMARASQPSLQQNAAWTLPSATQPLNGVGASPGLVIGTTYRLDSEDIVVDDKPVSLIEGSTLLNNAIDKTRQQMKALIDDTTRRLGRHDAAIFEAQAALLEDTDLITAACRYMIDGHGVAWSWHEAIEAMAGQLSSLDNPTLAARAADIRDIGKRVLLQLEPSAAKNNALHLPEGPIIILAKDLSPSDTASLDPTKIAGIATSLGGPTAHTAILARTLGIAAVVAVSEDLLSIADGTTVIVDGDHGRLWIAPSQETLAVANERIDKLRIKHDQEAAKRGLPAKTSDGFQIEVAANVNRPDQVSLALEQGAEGVGLMRTEFLFLEMGDTPSEDEQYATYRDMAKALDGRNLIVRTLDIGGDKQVAHLHLPHEDNPFLGVRGSRLLLRRDDLFIPQMRALYRAAKDYNNFSIMFPMITSVAEIVELRARCETIRTEIGAPTIPIGIMIEVPAAAIMADKLAEHVDFFSIGTNDLTQYALAIDRQNPELATEADSLHPAVLRLIQLTVAGAAKHNRWVGVCGGIAGDPFGAALLAGIGVNELSMTPRDIPAVKAAIRATTKDALQKLAARALDMSCAKEVRALSRDLTQEPVA